MNRYQKVIARLVKADIELNEFELNQVNSFCTLRRAWREELNYLGNNYMAIKSRTDYILIQTEERKKMLKKYEKMIKNYLQYS